MCFSGAFSGPLHIQSYCNAAPGDSLSPTGPHAPVMSRPLVGGAIGRARGNMQLWEACNCGKHARLTRFIREDTAMQIRINRIRVCLYKIKKHVAETLARATRSSTRRVTAHCLLFFASLAGCEDAAALRQCTLQPAAIVPKTLQISEHVLQ